MEFHKTEDVEKFFAQIGRVMWLGNHPFLMAHTILPTFYKGKEVEIDPRFLGQFNCIFDIEQPRNIASLKPFLHDGSGFIITPHAEGEVFGRLYEKFVILKI